jgi:hypothetical protein
VEDELREVRGRGGDLCPGWRRGLEGLSWDCREFRGAADFVGGMV